MKMEMEEKIFEFVGWIYKNYGRVGCGIALFIMIAILALAFLFFE